MTSERENERSPDQKPMKARAKDLAIGATVGTAVTLIILFALVAIQLKGNPLKPGPELGRIIPSDATSVTIWDLDQLRKKDYLVIHPQQPTTEQFIQDQMILLNQNEAVDPYELSLYILLRRPGWEPLELAHGNIDFLYTELELEEAGYRRDNYRGYDIWIGDHVYALIPEYNYLAATNSRTAVEQFLNHFHRAEGMNQMDPDVPLAKVINKAGNQTALRAERGREHCPISRCQALVVTPLHYDPVEDNIKAEFKLLFRSEESAERAAWEYNDVANHIENKFHLEVLDLERNGQYVTGQATGRYSFITALK